MNNYLISESEEDRLKREQLQERNYRIFDQLQEMSSELPFQYQQRLSLELLRSLAQCLLDDRIPQVVNELKENQKNLEKTLYERRSKSIEHLKASKLELHKRNKEAIMLRTMNQEQATKKELEFDQYMSDEIKKIDVKIIDDLDQCLKEQQENLEKLGVPGFFVTDGHNQMDIKLQMYILDFIMRI